MLINLCAETITNSTINSIISITSISTSILLIDYILIIVLFRGVRGTKSEGRLWKEMHRFIIMYIILIYIL